MHTTLEAFESQEKKYGAGPALPKGVSNKCPRAGASGICGSALVGRVVDHIACHT